jgi:NifB/MoaA-like Fe-S oxidoreductase
VDVAGLLTGKDIIAQLEGKPLGSRLLLAQNMLRHGENVFLDDVTPDDVSKALGVPIRIVAQDGGDLARAICGA